jgi:hypothetical protein
MRWEQDSNLHYSKATTFTITLPVKLPQQVIVFPISHIAIPISNREHVPISLVRISACRALLTAILCFQDVVVLDLCFFIPH